MYYSTDSDLKRIRNWKPQNPDESWADLLNFIGSCWNSKGSWEVFENRVYQIFTGGHIENEKLIVALRQNTLFWITCWEESRRGGYYKFEIPQK